MQKGPVQSLWATLLMQLATDLSPLAQAIPIMRPVQPAHPVVAIFKVHKQMQLEIYLLQSAADRKHLKTTRWLSAPVPMQTIRTIQP